MVLVMVTESIGIMQAVIAPAADESQRKKTKEKA